MSEDELADARALGDAADLSDVGVQCGHPFQGGAGGPMPFQEAGVGHFVDEDVGVPGERDHAVVGGGVVNDERYWLTSGTGPV